MKRVFWIAVGAGLGVLAVAKAKAYVQEHTPDRPRQFLFGPDEQDENLTAQTLKALYDDFRENQRQRENELTRRFLVKHPDSQAQ
ncbi:MAG: hypothetical protein IIT36_02345 [Aeriscardovia sp.]|nr:hypothetical protein [Aeriscardovia sp.]